MEPYEIRLFRPNDADFAALEAVDKAMWPDSHDVAADFRLDWDIFDHESGGVYQRYMLERDGCVIASILFKERWWSREPGKYYIHILYDPTCVAADFGQELYELTLSLLEPYRPKKLEAFTIEDRTLYRDLLERNGFEVVMRYPVSRLDLSAFDFGRYADLEQRMAESGLQLMPHPEFVATSPDWARRYYDFEWEITQDVPMHSPPTRPAFDHWIKFVDFPGFTPAAWWVALDKGVPVGTSSLWVSQKEPTLASTGLTGVRRAYRRRGLATALKLKGLHWACDNGFTTIQTDNEENNPMYGLNLALGFVPAPAELEYRNVLSDGE